jgi:predicted TIM-barrel fold metal-dependent hydrolase
MSVFDADNHFYETRDALTRYLPRELASLFRYVELNGRTRLLVRGVLNEYLPNPTFDKVAAPGSLADYFSGRNPEGRSMREMMGAPVDCSPAFRRPVDRLSLLDDQGVHAALMFPTLASLIEVNFSDLPRVTMQMLHAFNRWLLDEWTYAFEDRIFATPILNPAIVDDALDELEFVLEHGAKVALLRPAPVAGSPTTRSPFLPEFDPFWARVQESGLVIAMHASDSGYQRYANDWEGSEAGFTVFKQSSFGIALMPRPITDTVLSAICHGMLTRFPNVRLMSVENGGSWVQPALKELDSVYKKVPQDFAEHPRETFLRSIYVSPFWEESLDDLIDTIGAERVCFGSDYPHPEGMADPLGHLDELAGRSDEEVRRIMGGNLYELLDVAPRPVVRTA